MSEENPWKTVSSRLVYKNPWISVREDQVVRPDGKPGIYGVVDTRYATGVVALTPNDEVYLVGQYRYPINAYSWEIVEGGADEGEDPFEAIQRELAEEAGLKASEWSELGAEFHLSNCFSSERAKVYLARGLTPIPSSPEGTEVLQVKKVPLDDAIAMVDRGEITDTITIVALHRAEKVIKGKSKVIPLRRLS